ncbi:hypothetical protein GCM10027589_47470 [Actinocorallia lasiicapitis]
MTRTTSPHPEPPKSGSSRHGKPRSAFERGLDRLMDSPSRRYTASVLAGMVCVGVLLAVVFGVFGGQNGAGPAAGSGKKRAEAAAVTAPATPTPSDDLAAALDDSDEAITAHLKEKSPKHFREARWSGDFLRVYTDLDEGDTEHPDAKKLCDEAVAYLRQGDENAEPVVFVHAKKSGNGHVVLVNNTGGKCHSVETR